MQTQLFTLPVEIPSRGVGGFQTVVIDPPWPMPKFNGWGSKQVLPYRAMSLDDIARIPIPSVLKKEGYLFLWAVTKHLPAAYALLEGWECTHKQTVVWCKKEERRGLGGMFASDVEFCIIAQRIKPGTNAHGTRTKKKRAGTSWFNWPVRGHSVKPDEFYSLVEEVSAGPYLDVFARRTRVGWTSVGDAIDGLDVMTALAALASAC